MFTCLAVTGCSFLDPQTNRNFIVLSGHNLAMKIFVGFQGSSRAMYCTVMLQVWPKLASFFDLPVGEPQKFSMVTVMADYVSPLTQALYMPWYKSLRMPCPLWPWLLPCVRPGFPGVRVRGMQPNEFRVSVCRRTLGTAL